MERKEKLESILMGLMKSLEMSMYRAIFSMALIRSYRLHEEMIDWVASFHDSEETITLQSFTAKLNELIAEKQTIGK